MIYEELFTEDLIKVIEWNEINQDIDNQLQNIESQKEILLLLREKLSFVTIWSFELIHIKESDLNKTFEAIAKVIIKKEFAESKTTKLLNILNQIVMYSAINELTSIDENTKIKNKWLLKERIKLLISIFKEKNNIKNSIIKKEVIKETITEKIKRINDKKKLLQKSNS